MHITFTADYVMPIATADGPSTRTFPADSVMQIDESAAGMYLAGGYARHSTQAEIDEFASGQPDPSDRPLEDRTREELAALLAEIDPDFDPESQHTVGELAAAIEARQAETESATEQPLDKFTKPELVDTLLALDATVDPLLLKKLTKPEIIDLVVALRTAAVASTAAGTGE